MGFSVEFLGHGDIKYTEDGPDNMHYVKHVTAPNNRCQTNLFYCLSPLILIPLYASEKL
jgi:hypothetical protein